MKNVKNTCQNKINKKTSIDCSKIRTISRPERSWGWHWPHSEVLATPPSRIGGLRRHIEHLLELSEQHVSIVCHHYRLLMIKIVIMLIEPLTERWLKMMLVYTSNLGGRRCCRVDSWFDHRLELFNIVWVERWSASSVRRQRLIMQHD